MTSKTHEQLDRYVRARYPIAAIISHEENRVMAGINVVADKRQRKVAIWMFAQGLQKVEGRNPTVNLTTMLAYSQDGDSTTPTFLPQNRK